MTCIVAIISDEGMYLGADSCVTLADEILTVEIAQPKIWRMGDAIVGFRGTLDVLEAARSIEFKSIQPDGDEIEYVKDIAAAIEKCLKNKSIMATDTCECLVGYRNLLFQLSISQSVKILKPPVENYWAIGCAQAYALGSLSSTLEEGALVRISKALESCAAFDYRVKKPFTYIHSPLSRGTGYNDNLTAKPLTSSFRCQIASRYRMRASSGR